jgi:hypothetical protein
MLLIQAVNLARARYVRQKTESGNTCSEVLGVYEQMDPRFCLRSTGCSHKYVVLSG